MPADAPLSNQLDRAIDALQALRGTLRVLKSEIEDVKRATEQRIVPERLRQIVEDVGQALGPLAQ